MSWLVVPEPESAFEVSEDPVVGRSAQVGDPYFAVFGKDVVSQISSVGDVSRTGRMEEGKERGDGSREGTKGVNLRSVQ